MAIIYENQQIRIETEESEIPWLKVFTRDPYMEMSEVPSSIKQEIYALLDLIEMEMIGYYHPDKINIASFGNYLPHVHWHIMARFKNDSYFPEPMWGRVQRNSTLSLPSFSEFCNNISNLILKRMNALEGS